MHTQTTTTSAGTPPSLSRLLSLDKPVCDDSARSWHHTRAAAGGVLWLHRVAERSVRRDRERTGRPVLQSRKSWHEAIL